MALEPILESIGRARREGHRKITLLGGEPTLQPHFLEIVRRTVDLAFEEIVIFTNGAKTARAGFIDEIRATGGPFTWRISIQGASRESHERTTLKKGSFGRILRTLSNLAERGQRITVNTCVVRTNFEDLDAFPALLAPYGVTQLHLDMVRPLDSGTRSEEELRAMIPRYSDLAPVLSRMVAGFLPGFDANIGNLPYCISPELTEFIHHDGEPTQTVAVDADNQLSRPWDKYLVKRRDKLKPESCRRCVLDSRCSGVFETYARFYGLGELEPIDADALRTIDRGGKLLGLWAPPLLSGELRAAVVGDSEVRLGDGAHAITLRPASAREGAIALYDHFSVHSVAGSPEANLGSPTLELMRSALERLSAPVHPLGDDAFRASPPLLAGALRRLRARAPFDTLRWRSLALDAAGRRAELRLEAPGGAVAEIWLELADSRPRAGYRVHGEPSEGLARGLSAALLAARGE